MSDEQKRTAKCSCGADIEEVLDTPLSAGKFWLRVGTTEVCVDNHWHEPEPPSERVQAIERMAEAADRDGRYDDVILPETLPEIPEVTVPEGDAAVDKRYGVQDGYTPGFCDDPEPQERPTRLAARILDLITNREWAAITTPEDRIKIIGGMISERLGAAEQRANEAREDAVKLQRHRDHWRGYVYGKRDKPRDFIGGDMVDRPQTKLELLKAERDRLKEQLELAAIGLKRIRETVGSPGTSREIWMVADSALTDGNYAPPLLDLIAEHDAPLRAKVAELESKLAKAERQRDLWGNAVKQGICPACSHPINRHGIGKYSGEPKCFDCEGDGQVMCSEVTKTAAAHDA